MGSVYGHLGPIAFGPVARQYIMAGAVCRLRAAHLMAAGGGKRGREGVKIPIRSSRAYPSDLPSFMPILLKVLPPPQNITG
jgi:hypothetical protein